MHYAIQEHRLETTKLLLDKGADPFSKSQNGDDALTTACLNGSQQIFDLLKSRIKYSAERLADAHELIGSTFLDEHNETRVAILHWRLAHHTRLMESISELFCQCLNKQIYLNVYFLQKNVQQYRYELRMETLLNFLR